jgi:hypothetical protein
MHLHFAKRLIKSALEMLVRSLDTNDTNAKQQKEI